MHPQLQARLLSRSLAEGVCHSVQNTTPKFRKPQRASRFSAVFVAIGWAFIALVCVLALVAAR